MNYKRIELPMDSVPNYSLNDIFMLITVAGYTIENGNVSASEPATEDDYRMLWTQFTISGIPILETLPDSIDTAVLSGSTKVMIAAVETVYPDMYYVEDVIMSEVRVPGADLGYTSFMISDLMRGMIKSLLIIKPVQQAPLAETTSVN